VAAEIQDETDRLARGDHDRLGRSSGA
jgi:hypothetical protein